VDTNLILQTRIYGEHPLEMNGTYATNLWNVTYPCN